MQPTNPFQSFWMAGFECSDQMNAFGYRVDLLEMTQHVQLIDDDYERLQYFNMHTVREGIRWSVVERLPYHYNWEGVEKRIHAAAKNNIQIVWDVCHFGYPDDLSPLHPQFVNRFVALCKAFVHFYRQIDEYGELIITPINEVSFISWLGGDVKGTVPYCTEQGWDVKYNLMRAYIQGIKAIKAIDENIRILSTEPLVNIVAGDDGEECMVLAQGKHNEQFQVWDILSGRMCPELGGQPEYLDIMGVNFYSNNQWIYPREEFICWKTKDVLSGWRPLNDLINSVYEKYKRPFIISETSHPHEDRPFWIQDVTEACTALLREELPLWGVCIYPIIDRPDWDHIDTWHRSGLWDIPGKKENPERILYEPYADAILSMQTLLQPMIKNKNIKSLMNYEKALRV